MGIPIPFVCLLLAVPAAAYALSRRFSAEPGSRGGTAARYGVLFFLGLVAARPFLSYRAVGTGEAYNYSLAVDDALTQMRAGVIPPLAGQTEFAFNGRIHPLRNAPYLFYLAAGLDLATFHQLSAWQLQNLSLAFSLVAAFFACYGGLRWGTDCGRRTALLLAIAYGFSPPILASAYSANLFMTVHAAVFVPLALGACFRQCRHPSALADALLGVALAGAWLAHPPVAYWLTLAIALVRGLIFLRYPTWKALGGLAWAGALWAVLAAFVLVSVASISADVGFFNAAGNFGATLMPILQSAFPGCLLPAPRLPEAAAVSDFQLGYVGWALWLALGAALAWPGLPFRQRPRSCWALAGAFAAASTLLVLTLPVPWLTVRLWNHSPVSAQALTNIWPMQRVYLVATGLIFFSAALILPRRMPGGRAARAAGAAAAALGLGWIGWEASGYLARGLAMRWSKADTIGSHRSSNIDLTITAYSFLGAPPTFVNGVMDPAMDFRLLADGNTQVASNFQEARRTAPVVAQGVLQLAGGPGPVRETLPKRVTLQPGKRYLLGFSFHTPPVKGALFLTGPSLSRHYLLPEAGSAEGFGMEPGNRRALSLWTAQDQPEEVEIRFQLTPETPLPAARGVFADFTLQEVAPGSLPVRLESLLPLRFTVDAPQAGEYVDTFRRWLPGYIADVNGRTLDPLRSPIWDVMVPVPKGRSEVELRYVGRPSVRAAFWLSAAGWLGFMIWIGCRACRLDARCQVRRAVLQGLAWPARHWPAVIFLVVAAALAAWFKVRAQRQAAELGAFGPLEVSFYLPFHEPGRTQPLVTTGHAGAGATVFLRYLEGDRMQAGADIWGTAYGGPPVAANPFQPHTLVVDSSALYPAANPRLAALPAAERQRLLGEFQVELDGRVAIRAPRSAFPSTLSELAIGRNSIGTSGVEPQFDGEILGVRRLPPTRRWILAGRDTLRLRLRPPPASHAGAMETFLALGPEGREGACAIGSAEGAVRLAQFAPDGRLVASGEFKSGPGSALELALSFGRPDPGAPPLVTCRLDGRLLFGPAEPAPLSPPEEALVGASPRPPAGAAARFTGPELTIENPAPSANLPGTGFGPVRLIALLPADQAHRQQPLVTTGRTGRGDFVYVVYLDSSHIRLGFDHWGVGGGLSDPIAVDYSRPHEFVISLGSLYPADGGDAAWGRVPPAERRRLQGEMTVRLDGAEVYRAAFAAHPSNPAEVVAGLNPIGGSSCDPAFTGVIFSAERQGLR